MSEYIEKCQCYIHSLKQGERNVLAEATIIKRLGDNDYLAEYGGVRCHAIFNPFVGRYFVDDKYGVIREPAARQHSRQPYGGGKSDGICPRPYFRKEVAIF